MQGEEDSADVSKRYWADVAARCRELGLDSALVVEKFERNGTLMDVYEVAVELPKIVRGLRVAFIDRTAEDYDENIFGENVAVNRGAVGRVFRDEPSAISWLLS